MKYVLADDAHEVWNLSPTYENPKIRSFQFQTSDSFYSGDLYTACDSHKYESHLVAYYSTEMRIIPQGRNILNFWEIYLEFHVPKRNSFLL